MKWTIEFHSQFDEEYETLSEAVQDMLLRKLELLRRFGPMTERPLVDTLDGSKHSNMKELRFDADNGVWRVAFAFDPERKAIILVAGDKTGVHQKRFYKQLIKTADARFDDHLNTMKD